MRTATLLLMLLVAPTSCFMIASPVARPIAAPSRPAILRTSEPQATTALAVPAVFARRALVGCVVPVVACAWAQVMNAISRLSLIHI